MLVIAKDIADLDSLKSAVRDGRLSLAARGLYVRLQSMPQGIRMAELIEENPDYDIEDLLQSLEGFGYVSLIP